MSNGGRGAAWVIVICLSILNGALFGAVTYLRHHNPAHWVMISDDFQKILLARQYPDRLVAESVSYDTVVGIELQGASTFMEPARAEVYANTETGERVLVHYANSGADVHAEDLSKRLSVPLRAINYEKNPLSGLDNPRPKAQGLPAAQGQLPTLPDAR